MASQNISSEKDKWGLKKEEHFFDKWTKIGKKVGGANSPGVFGGVYKLVSSGITALIKQDTSGKKVHSDKNIAEFLGASMFTAVADRSAAKVFLAVKSGDIDVPDKKGDNVYVGSIFFDNYKDLYVDAHESRGLKAPKSRPRNVGTFNKSYFKKALEREDYTYYKDFPETMATSLLIGDFDIHWANVGVVRDPGQSPRLVRIDYAGAFERLEDEIHPHSHSRHPVGLGPTNHFREYPRKLKITPEFAKELDRVGNFDFKPTIDAAFEELAKYYGPEPLGKFAKRLGMSKNELKNLPDNEVFEGVKKFFIEKMEARQTSLKSFATEIKIDLCLNKNDSGKWELDGYKDPEGNHVSFEDVIKDNKQYFKEILEGKRNIHFRDNVHKAKWYNIGDVLSGKERKLKKFVKAEIKKHEDLIYEKESHVNEKVGQENKDEKQGFKRELEEKLQHRNKFQAKYNSGKSDKTYAGKAGKKEANIIKPKGNKELIQELKVKFEERKESGYEEVVKSENLEKGGGNSIGK